MADGVAMTGRTGRPRRRRPLRWLLYALAAAVGAALLATLVLLIVFHSGWGREQLRSRLQEAINDAIVGQVRVGRISGSLFSEIELRDVEIFDAAGRTAIAVERVRTKIAPLALLHRHVAVEHLAIDGLRVNGVREPDGRLNLETLSKPSEGPSFLDTWSVHVDGLALRRAHIALPVESEGDARAVIDGLDLDGVVSAGRERIEVRLAAMKATATERHLPGPTKLDIPAARIDLFGDQVAITADATATSTDTVVAVGIRPGATAGVHAVAIHAQAPAGRVTTALAVDLDARRVSGAILVRAADVARVSAGAPASQFDADLAVDLAVDSRATGLAALRGGAAILSVRGKLGEVVLDSASGTARIESGIVRFSVGARAAGGASIYTVGRVDERPDGLTLTAGEIHARAPDLGALPGLGGQLAGDARVDLTAAGVLTPALGLRVQGRVDAHRLRAGDAAVEAVQLEADLTGMPWAPRGRADLTARGVRIGGESAGTVTVHAEPRADGGVDVAVHSRDRGRWEIDAAAALWLRAGAIQVALGAHRGVASGVAWSGSGGVITAGGGRVDVKDFAVRVAGGEIAASGTYWSAGRRAGAADGDLRVTGLDLAQLRGAPGLDGASGTVSLRAKGGLVGGSPHVAVAGQLRDVILPGLPQVSAELDLDAAPGAVRGTVAARSPGLGAVDAQLDVAAPARLDDVAAWQRLERSALRRIHVDLRDIDVGGAATRAGIAGLAGTAAGRIDITAGAPTASLKVRRAVIAGAGRDQTFELGLEVVPAAAGAATATLDVTGALTARALVTAALPERPLSPAAWQALGRQAIHQAIVRADAVPLDGTLVAQLGLLGYHGKVWVRVDLAPGLASAALDVSAKGLRGGPLFDPVDVAVEATLSGDQTRADVSVQNAAVPLVTGHVAVNAGLIALERTGAAAFEQARLDAALTIPHVPAMRLAHVFGRHDVTAGAIDAAITVAGTAAAPRASVEATITDAEVAGVGVPKARLVARGDRAGVSGTLRIDQTRGAMLTVSGKVDLAGGGGASARIYASRFDLRPLGGLAPPSVSGLAGALSADLAIEGRDLAHARVAGVAHLRNGRLPTGGPLGILRDAQLDLSIRDQVVQATGSGRVGTGRLTIKKVTARLDGVMPASVDADLELRGVPIQVKTWQPIVDGKVAVQARRGRDLWTADVAVSRSQVLLEEITDKDILPADMPEDLILIDSPQPTKKLVAAAPTAAKPPPARLPTTRAAVPARRAWLKVDLRVAPATIRSRDLRTVIAGQLTTWIGGPDIRVEGRLDSDEGFIELVGRRYQLRTAAAWFDGTTDPHVQVRLAYDFPEMTLYIDVRGRVSAPQVSFSSDPPLYSEAQLLSFFLGASPGSAPGNETQQAATSVAASLVSQRLRQYVDKVLPLPIDVLRVQTSTTDSSGSVTVGNWLTARMLVAYQRRLEARTNENTNEAQLEYWLRRNVLFQAYGGTTAFGGDLMWIFRY